MRTKTFKSILWYGIAGLLIFSPLAKGSVRIWSISVVEYIILIMLFTWFWYLINRTKHRSEETRTRLFLRTRLDFPIWLFVILAGVSCYFSIYKFASGFEIVRLLAIVGLYYLVVNNFEQERIYRLSILVVYIAAGLSLFGLSQYFLGINHSWWNPPNFIASSYVNHNHFAGYLELALPLALGLFIFTKKNTSDFIYNQKVLRLGLSIAAALMFFALIFSQSRGAWASITIALIVMHISLVRRKLLTKKSFIIFLLIIILVIAYVHAGTDSIAVRLRTVEEFGVGFFNGREKMWSGSIAMIKDNPLIGTGIGTFVWGFSNYRPEGLGGRLHYAHNDYLHMMSEMGVFVFPLMLWLILAVILSGYRKKKEHIKEHIKEKEAFNVMDGINLGCATGILSLSLHGLVDFNFHITANLIVVACFAAIIMRKEENSV